MAYNDVIRKFVEEDYKDCVIHVVCDNEHKFWDNTPFYPDLIWDWDNERFMALEPNDETIDQNRHPMMITSVDLSLIQFLVAYPNKEETIKFINDNYTDEDKKKKALAIFQKAAPGMMGPRTLRKNIDDPEFKA